MCGIFGVVNFSGYNAKYSKVCEWWSDMCHVGVLRGSDSTGMFQVPRFTGKKDMPFKMKKLPIMGTFFLADKQVQEMIRAADSAFCTIGHHRAATHGTVSHANAHPFVHGSHREKDLVVGVHNGTLHGFDRANFDVDSDWLYSEIQSKGAEEALRDVSGAYALVWYEQATNRLRIASNGGRSIFWTTIKDSNVMLIGSEHPMVHMAAHRRELVLEQFYTTKIGKIYSWELVDKLDPRKDFTVQEILPRTIVESTASRGTHDSRAPFRNTETRTTSSTTASGTAVDGRVTSTNSITHFDAGTQTTIISQHNPDACEQKLADYGLVWGQEVEFCNIYDKKNVACYTSNDLAGLCAPTFDSYEGATSCVSAVMLGATPQIRANIEDASMIKARIVGFRTTHQKIDNRTNDVQEHILVGTPFLLEYKEGTRREVPIIREESSDDLNLRELEDPTDWIVNDKEERLVEGPRRRKLTLKQFNEKVKHGCAQCSTDLTVQDAEAGWIVWADDEPVCMDCHQSFLANRSGG